MRAWCQFSVSNCCARLCPQANAAVASGEAEKLAVSTKVKEQCEAGDSDATDGGFALYFLPSFLASSAG